MRYKVSALPAVVALACAAQPAMAADKSSGSYQVSARIPVSCNIDTRSIIAQGSASVVSGTVFEACNTNSGFQVIATHRSLGEDERVQVRYGSDFSELNQTGVSYVGQRWGARFGPVPVQIDARQVDAPIAISFSLIAV
ncbi:hypothetical protein [Erythrobacter sp. THAF29]|uniref:hypothetical protein n=1 Tax=Erythrobacter sp. THAF29 TaxID=2587851 RepID=UPI001268EEDA|nr:hypothetical protein [Erythrobacter sp. THAF29]QFT76072.1 hypothetical protein FIU90_00820 [Erythrobacter sp. THAF29]